jgi:aspartate racemase
MPPVELPRLGVLGGMGPLATVDFMHKLVDATPAARDQEHMPVIVHSVPQIPDRSAAYLSGSDTPWPYLLDGLRTLERAGADAIAIPCNTAHIWHPRLEQASQVKVLHIGRVSCEAIVHQAGRTGRIGLLATSATLRSHIYHDELERAGLAVVDPDAESQQACVMAGIAAVKAGRLDNGRALLTRAAQALLAEPLDALLLACTEIPVALAGADFGVPAVDATDLLARACVDWWRTTCRTRHSTSPIANHVHD